MNDFAPDPVDVDSSACASCRPCAVRPTLGELRGLALCAVLSLASCHPESGALVAGEGPGTLALIAVTPPLSAPAPTQWRAYISGNGNTVELNGSPGGSVSHTTSPGNYRVTLLGLVQGSVVLFGELAGVQVRAGEQSMVSIVANSAVPPRPSGPTSVSPGNSATMQWSPVGGTPGGYQVQVATDLSFSSPETLNASGTSISFTPSAPGQYHFRVRGRFGPQSVPGYWSETGTLVATAPPSIQLSDTSRIFTAVVGGGSPAPQTVSVTNGGGGTLSGLTCGPIEYGQGQPTGWLTCSVSPTTAPATVTLSVTTGSRAAGTYTATVPVRSGVANNSPQNISVTFEVSGRFTIRNDFHGGIGVRRVSDGQFTELLPGEVGIFPANAPTDMELRNCGRPGGCRWDLYRLEPARDYRVIGDPPGSIDIRIIDLGSDGTLGVGFSDEQFALLSPGSFQMGSTDGLEAERPVHTVNLTRPFYMQRTEVTQGQWREIMGSNPSWFSACGDTCPVENVSWTDFQQFLAALNARFPGRNYRLPTEAEWEYAARAGTTGDYGGTGVLDEMGWFEGNSNNQTASVARKTPNAWGLYDMHGNVWERVQDWYGPYTSSTKSDPTGPATGSDRAVRGGAYSSTAFQTRSAVRGGAPPGSRYPNVGFRLAWTP
jgi:hypothetical protein